MTKFSIILIACLILSKYAFAQVTNGLVYHFPFDWSLESNMNAGNNKIQVEGDFSYKNGKIGSGICFGTDSSDGQVSFTPIIKPNWDQFSISLWIKANSDIPYPNVHKDLIVAKYDDLLWSYRITQSRHISPDSAWITFSVRDYSYDNQISLNTTIDTSWNHITCTAKAEDTLAVYVDGIQKAVEYNPLKTSFSINYYTFGRDDNSFGCPVGTILDDVKIFRRQLLLDEANKLANTDSEFDLSLKTIYPNPISQGENLKIELSQIGNYKCNIHDFTGALVETANFEKTSELSISLSNHPPGVYFLSVYNNSYTSHFTETIIISN